MFHHRRFFVLVLVSLCLACVAFIGHAEDSDWVKIPMDFTLKENQSDNVDATVYMQYCFIASANLTVDMTIDELETLMADKRLYYAERIQENDDDGKLITEYRFLQTLALRLYGSPIESAILVVSCPEHTAAHVELPVSLYYSEGSMLAGLVSYDDTVNGQYGIEWGGQPVSEKAIENWRTTWNLMECFGKKHSVDYTAESTLLHYASLCAWACPGMTFDGLQVLLKSLLADYSSQIRATTDNNDQQFIYIQQGGLYKDAQLYLGYVFSKNKLTQSIILMSPPRCSDMFSSPLVYDESSRDAKKNYINTQYAPSIITNLEDSWYLHYLNQED